MLELALGIIIGAAFADFWKKLYLKTLITLKGWLDKSSLSETSGKPENH